MFFVLSMFLILVLIPAYGSAQNDPEKQENQPEIKWDVQKHLDENGNLIWFDSTYSWSRSNHDFGNMDLDSIFKKFHGEFKSIDSLFRIPFPSMPHTFSFPDEFPDSLFTMPFGPSPFPEAFMMPPDVEGFNHLFSFPDPEVWYEHQKELFEHYREMFEHFHFMDPFHEDSLQNLQYRQRYHQGDQKKSGREVEI
jgi:hypothetical protein